MKIFANHTTKLAGILLTLFIAVALMSTTTQTRVTEVPLGTVILNMIPPEIFLAEEENKGWAFLNGQQMDKSWELTARINSEYDNSIFEHLREKLPDARGQFLRSMNHGGYGLDTWKDRKVGVSQKAWLKKHNHDFKVSVNGKTKSGGSHNHRVGINHFELNPDRQYSHPIASMNGGAYDRSRWVAAVPKNKDFLMPFFRSEITDHNGTHQHSFSFNYRGTTDFQDKWGTETRPVNVGLYAYIKVD